MLLKPHASINMHHLDKSGDFCAGTMRAIAGFLVLLVVFQTCAFASDLRSGIECNTGRTIHFRVSAGYGYIDDINGWDFFNGDASVFDGAANPAIDAHGTHVAGTIGGVGGNGQGVAGVNWSVKIV